MDSQNNQNKGQNSSEKEKANNNTVMAVLSYIGPLVIISYLVSRSNQFVKFHIKPHMKNFIWIGAVVIILISLMFWGVSGGNTIKPPFDVGVVHPLDHVSGNASSSVVVIEYSDF